MQVGNDYVFNERNFDYLANQLKFTGFGEALNTKLKEAMKDGNREFSLPYKPEFGKETAATLNFRLSDKGNYFFQNYDLEVQQKEGSLKQRFYIQPAEKAITSNGSDLWINSTIPLKEGFNLLEGRAALKNYLTKDKDQYQAWTMLNFKETDKYGNFLIEKKSGYDLEAKLKEYPIKMLQEPEAVASLLQSLAKGNRQVVTLDLNGKETKLTVEAKPIYKTVAFYEGDQRRSIKKELQQDANQQGQSQKEGKKEKMAQSAGNDDAPEQAPAKKKKSRKLSA